MTLPTVDATGILNSILTVVLIVIVLIFAVVIVLMKKKEMWIFKKFPVEVLSIEPRADGITFTKDMARLMVEGGKPLYEYKIAKVKLPATDKKHLTANNKLVVVSSNRGEYIPATLRITEIEIEEADDNGAKIKTKKAFVDVTPIITSEMKVALANTLDEINYRFDWKSSLEKWLPVITLATMGIMVAIISWVIMGRIGDFMGTAASISAQQAETTKQLAQILNKTTSQIPPIPGK